MSCKWKEKRGVRKNRTPRLDGQLGFRSFRCRGNEAVLRRGHITVRVHSIEQRVASKMDVGNDGTRSALRSGMVRLCDFDYIGICKGARQKATGRVLDEEKRIGIAIIFG